MQAYVYNIYNIYIKSVDKLVSRSVFTFFCCSPNEFLMPFFISSTISIIGHVGKNSIKMSKMA